MLTLPLVLVLMRRNVALLHGIIHLAKICREWHEEDVSTRTQTNKVGFTVDHKTGTRARRNAAGMYILYSGGARIPG